MLISVGTALETLRNHLCTRMHTKWMISCDSSKIKITARVPKNVWNIEHTKAKDTPVQAKMPEAVIKRSG